MTETDAISAPVIISSAWKSWTYAEGRNQCQRIVPEGNLVHIDEHNLAFFEDMRSGNRYAVPPLTPDQRAWKEANQPGTKTSLPPFSYLSGAQVVHSPQGYAYLASYFGVAVPALQLANQLSTWVGLSDGNWLIQAVMQNSALGDSGAGLQNWTLHNEIASNGGSYDIKSYPVPFHVPNAAWGVVRYYGASRQWVINFYRGTRGNAGPAFGQPIANALTLTLADYPGLIKLKAAICAFELPGGVYNSCSEVSVTSVWGGLTAKNSQQVVPIWTPNGQLPGLTCPSTSTMLSNGSQGNAQCTGVVSS